MTDAFDRRTLRFYSDSAEAYLDARPDNISRHLLDFLRLLPTGGSVLELGCGAGRDAEAMIAAGFQVEPTDGVPEVADIASKRIGHPVQVMRFDQLDVTETYDAVWANASLHHSPRNELPSVLQAIFRSLKPGGLHFANFKRGTSDARDDKDRHYSHLTLQSLRDLYARSANWDVISSIEYEGGGEYEGSNSPWVAIIVRKPR